MAHQAPADYHLTLREWPETERPRERLLHHGPESLSNAELLGIILRTGIAGQTAVGVAENLLVGFGGVAGLRRATVTELVRRQPGLGPAKAAQLKAALELGHRLTVLDSKPRKVTGAADVADLLMLEMSQLEQEQLRLVLLNTKNDVLAMPIIYTGGLRTSLVRVAEVFRQPIRDNASGIILVHNHPSGDPTPSPEDVRLTHEVATMGEQLDIDVIDHVIIGRGRWISLRSMGLGFPKSKTSA